MKMVIAIVQDSDSSRLTSKLVENKFQVTKLSTSGGFLREGNTTLMIGVEDERLDTLLEVIKNNCKSRDQLITPMMPSAGGTEAFVPFPIEVKVGGATIFVLPIDAFHKY